MENEIKNIIFSTAKKFGVKRLFLFGSALTTDNYRDIDLASEGINGLQILKFAGELENILNINVDIIDLSANTPFSNYIREKAQKLYESCGPKKRN